MLPQKDRETLREAGILDTDHFLSTLADLVRSQPGGLFLGAGLSQNALTEAEEVYLREAGARGVDEENNADIRLQQVSQMTDEYQQLIGDSYGAKEVAKLLGVSDSRIRQRLSDRELYSVETNEGRVFPCFQFSNNQPLPGLKTVLAAINPKVHPLSVKRFFETPQVDLESSDLTGPQKPRDWLTTGHSPEDVVVIARDL